jgi:hypothetical protein
MKVLRLMDIGRVLENRFVPHDPSCLNPNIRHVLCIIASFGYNKQVACCPKYVISVDYKGDTCEMGTCQC